MTQEHSKVVAKIMAAFTAFYLVYLVINLINYLRIGELIYGSQSAALMRADGWDAIILLTLNGMLLVGLLMRRWWSTLLVIAVLDVAYFLRDATTAPILGIIVIVGLLIPGTSTVFTHDEA